MARALRVDERSIVIGGVEERERTVKRTRIRHKVRIPARLTAEKTEPIDCEIQDISREGMYLRFRLPVPESGPQPLSVGTRVSITFLAGRAAGTRRASTLSAQIMRRHEHGVGVQLAHLGREDLALLRSIARAVVETGATARTELPGRTGPSPDVVLKACRKTIERHLPKLISTLIGEVSKQLLPPPEGAIDRLADRRTLQDKSTAIGRTIDRMVLMSYAELCGLDSTQELVMLPSLSAGTGGPGGQANAKLSVMDADAVEDEVTLSMISERVEKRTRALSFELSLRFADLLKKRVDSAANPLTPNSMCRTLWHALANHHDISRLRAGGVDVIAARVAELLGVLYEDLHATLDQHEVARPYRSGK
ncbi:MAG: DUF1631 family protein [Gammaproteobacteria bacterium]|nr:DUF1631 family protein [Gammaproteobacteria bacterium]